MPHTYINPEAVSKPNNYTHVVSARGSRVVFISGQVAADQNGQVVGQGDLARQAEQVFENLKACLASVGAVF
jgi:enamine deaminase RidA (YjgF/YER057c/UK114 family)